MEIARDHRRLANFFRFRFTRNSRRNFGRRTRQFRRDGTGIFPSVGHGCVDARFVLFQEVPEKAVVQKHGTARLRQHAPAQECEFKGVVERNHVQDIVCVKKQN